MLRKTIILLNLFIIVSAINIYSQDIEILSLRKSDKSLYVGKLNSNITKSNLLSYCTSDFMIGKGEEERRRAFFQWNITDDEIPDGSTIKWAHLVITNIQGPTSYLGNIELSALFYKLETDLSQATGDYLWDTTDWFNNHKDNYIGYSVSDDFVIDQWFDQLSDFAIAIHDGLYNDYFALGIVSEDEADHEYKYILDNCDVKLEIQFIRPSKEVTLNQVLSDNSTTVGDINRWNGSAFNDVGNLPITLNFYVGTNEILQADESLFADTPKQKDQKWNDLSDVTNHHVFKISATTDQLTAHLNKTYESVSIKATLTNGGNGESIWFKDPWLIDYPDPDYGNVKRNRGMDDDGPDKLEFKQRPSPFTPDYTTGYNGDVYQGVFLDQGYDPVNNVWTPPYYEVKADAQQTFTAHGQQVTGYFLNWEGDNSKVQFQHADQTVTPLVFKSANAEARAVYKGHLAST